MPKRISVKTSWKLFRVNGSGIHFAGEANTSAAGFREVLAAQ